MMTPRGGRWHPSSEANPLRRLEGGTAPRVALPCVLVTLVGHTGEDRFAGLLAVPFAFVTRKRVPN